MYCQHCGKPVNEPGCDQLDVNGAHMHPRRAVQVTLFAVSGDNMAAPASTGVIADTPENRAALEAAAIPRCREWREAHPEPCIPECCYPTMCPNFDTPIGGHPAPYCCSAYCDRCAGLRALNGDDPALLPNEWMHHD